MNKELIIIGSGFTAHSCYFHLQQHGFENMLLISDQPRSGDGSSLGERASCTGNLINTYQDQITRLKEGFTDTQYRDLLSYSERSFSYLKSFCEQHKIGIKLGRVKRLARGEMEKRELTAAMKLYGEQGYRGNSIPWNDYHIHYTGELSASVDPKALLASLSREVSPNCQIHSKVLSLHESANGISLQLENGKEISAEMVILANHQGIARLVPFYSEVLIPYTDQWAKIITDKNFLGEQEHAFLNFSNIWLKSVSDHEVIFGGARYLRPFAGTGEKVAEFSAKSSNFCIEAMKNTFGATLGEITESSPFIGLRSCDEMPVIGPHFGSGRVLVAGGFMGSSATLGLMAGKCLSDIIADGRSDHLGASLTPDRLRSLAKGS